MQNCAIWEKFAVESILPIECKCCQGQAHYLGSLDFNKCCIDRFGERTFPVSPLQIPYWSCERCGFTFTNHMDQWSVEDFRREIYNDDYRLADPQVYGRDDVPPRETPAYESGKFISALLDGSQSQIRVLDFGAGANPGPTGLALLDNGFNLTSYDAYRADIAKEPEGQYDFIIAIEVVEHCHNLGELTDFMARHLGEHGMLWIATGLLAEPVTAEALNSWYVAPRNGHISIFSFTALAALFRPAGINIVQTMHGIVGFKNLPDYPNRLFV